MNGRCWRLLLTLSSVALLVITLPIESVAASLAHPALWRVQGDRGTVYLFGSIHVLPPNIDWRTPEIAAAIRRSSTLAFEIPNDAATQARIAELVAEKGQLQQGKSLRAMLSPDAQTDYDTDLAMSGVPASAVDGKRPCLADLVLVVRQMQQENA